MKPTQEQVIAWAREAGFVGQAIYHDVDGFLQFATLAYEAGRKDENEACIEAVRTTKYTRYASQSYVEQAALNREEAIEAIRARGRA